MVLVVVEEEGGICEMRDGGGGGGAWVTTCEDGGMWFIRASGDSVSLVICEIV